MDPQEFDVIVLGAGKILFTGLTPLPQFSDVSRQVSLGWQAAFQRHIHRLASPWLTHGLI